MADKETTEAPEAAAGDDTAVAEEAHDHDHAHGHDHDHEEFEFVEDPAFDVDYKGECAYEVGVTIPAANKQKQASELFDELSSEAELPGFRRGKAPRKLVERKFAKAVRGDVTQRLVAAAFHKLLKDKDFHPIALPDIDGLDDEADKPEDEALTFTLKFEVSPKVELGTYRGVEVEKPVLKVDESDVHARIEEIRSRYAAYETLEGGVAGEGDQTVIDFKGTIDGEEFAGGSATDYPYILGSQRFFPEFEEVLKGSSPGDELKTTVTFPEDYFSEDLRGKSAEFTITVKEVKRQSMPDVDDEFAKRAGFDGVDDMRAKLTEQLREAAVEESNAIAERRVLDAVTQASTFEIPKTLIEQTAAQNYEESIRRLLSMRVPADLIAERAEGMRVHAEQEAIGEIKRVVLLNEVGDAEGVEVTEEDFEQEMESMATRMGLDLNVLGDYVGADERRRNQYEERIFRAKALKVIMDNAKVTEREMTREELEAQLKDESGDEEAGAASE